MCGDHLNQGTKDTQVHVTQRSRWSSSCQTLSKRQTPVHRDYKTKDSFPTGLCVRSWLTNNPANMWNTCFSGESSHHTKRYFCHVFWTKNHDFSRFLIDFDDFLCRNIGYRPEVSDSYSLTSWTELIVVIHGEYIPPDTHTVVVSLHWGRSRRNSALKSWRSLPPDPGKDQYPLTGPTPQRSDLSHLPHPIDTVTRQPPGDSHRCH